MEVIRYGNPSDLRNRIEKLLLENEAGNNLFLGLLKQHSENEQLREPDHLWFCVEEGEEIELAGWRTPPYQYGLWSPRKNSEPAIRCFLEFLNENAMAVPGVVARKDVADTFYEVATSTMNLKPYFTMNQGIYDCHKVDQSLLGNGSLRAVRPEELELLTDWMIAFHIDVLNRELIRSEEREKLRKEIEEETYFFYELNGEAVSTAAASRSTKNGITINMVYTPPEYRRKGHATACVAQLTQKLLNDGWQFTSLYTDLDNPTSNNIYKKIGYNWVCQSSEIRFRPSRN